MIEEVAAGWYARVRLGQPSAEDEREFESWLTGDPAHRVAFEEYESLWGSLARYAPDPKVAAARRDLLARQALLARTPRWRISLISAAAAALAAAVVGWAALHDRPSAAAKTFVTAVGERSTVPLEDGSIVTLNTDSEIEPAYSAAERAVKLSKGQALFEVAKSSARPFVVYAGDRRIVALGTSFDVRVGEEGVRVTLIEGRVSVDSVGRLGPPARRTELVPGQEYRASGASTEIRKADVAAATSWKEGRLMFSDESLVDAVAEVNRYSATKVVLADPALNEMRVSGVFRVGQTAGFVSALEARFPVRIAERDGERIVLVLRNGPH
jgi:transmembrane sensor